MTTPHDVVLLAGARTPFGRIGGSLAQLSSVELGSHAIRAAVARSGIDPSDVEAVIMGQAVQAGAGQGPARQAAVAAGLGWNVFAQTINKVCLSGLTAIIDAARLIRSGDAQVVIAGGQESMSSGPHLLPGSRRGWPYGNITALDAVAHDGLTDAFDQVSMGAATERVVARLGVSRATQDRIAATSHQRAADATARGILAQEIAPVAVPQRRGSPLTMLDDESIRADTTIETLATLRAAFAPDGTITAGNASPLTDGAAAVVVVSRSWAQERGLPYLAVLGACGQVAGPDNSLTSQPARAIEQAMRREQISIADVDLVEINEAFAAVAAQSAAELQLPHDRLNIHGGAIALGHPLGASGARLALHAALELQRRGRGTAAVALCGGGGQGEALILHAA